MPTTPYARLLISVNSDTPVAGARTVSGGETIALSFESQVGWPGNPLARIEFYSYPEGWTGPGGAWTEEDVDVEGPTGATITYTAFVHESNSPPASFTMPSDWGKYLCRLIVNNGEKGGGQHEDMIDMTPGLEILSSQGLHDLAWREGEQFSAEPWRKWQGDQAANLRTINTALASVGSAAVAATPNTIALRGASGESSFTRVYTGGTVHSTAVLSVARLTTVIGGKTGAGDDHDFLAEDGADGLVYGSRARSALHAFRCKTTTGYLTVDVGAVEVMRVDATGLNIATGLAYKVNGVTIVSGASGTPTLGNTSSANTFINVASGGTISFQVNSAEKAAVDANGILLPTDKAVVIGSDSVISAPSNVPTLGHNSAAGVDLRVGAASIRILVNNIVVFEADPTGIAFFGTSTAGVQTVAGSRGGNAALASLLTALATFGVINDTTTA